MPQGWDTICEDSKMGFGKDGKGVIIVEQRSQAVGTLANSTGLFIGTKLATVEDFRMLKSMCNCIFTSVTAGELNGMALYLVHGDLTLAEAEEAIETDGPLGPGDLVDAEEAQRPVFQVGIVAHSEVQTEVVMIDIHSGAPMITAKPRWTFQSVSGWNWMLYNQGAAPTTGANAVITAKNFGVWVV